jgi:hypothetical protein
MLHFRCYSVSVLNSNFVSVVLNMAMVADEATILRTFAKTALSHFESSDSINNDSITITIIDRSYR